MTKKKTTWPSHPTKKHLLLVTTVWLLGMVALTLAVTEFFTKSFFNGDYLGLYFLMAISTSVAFETFRNYFWPKKTVSSES